MIAKNNPTPKNAYLICFSASFRITNKVRQIINIAKYPAKKESNISLFAKNGNNNKTSDRGKMSRKAITENTAVMIIFFIFTCLV